MHSLFCSGKSFTVRKGRKKVGGDGGERGRGVGEPTRLRAEEATFTVARAQSLSLESGRPRPARAGRSFIRGPRSRKWRRLRWLTSIHFVCTTYCPPPPPLLSPLGFFPRAAGQEAAGTVDDDNYDAFRTMWSEDDDEGGG
jgi:hypothetical protein